MEPITINLPTSALGWIAVLLVVLPFLAQAITVVAIRIWPQLKTRQRFAISVFASFFLMLVPGWTFLGWMHYATFSLESFELILPACLTVAGGKEVVYRLLQDFWKGFTNVPPAPDAPTGVDLTNPPSGNGPMTVALSMRAYDINYQQLDARGTFRYRVPPGEWQTKAAS